LKLIFQARFSGHQYYYGNGAFKDGLVMKVDASYSVVWLRREDTIEVFSAGQDPARSPASLFRLRHQADRAGGSVHGS
jgi:hypothetical protein